MSKKIYQKWMHRQGDVHELESEHIKESTAQKAYEKKQRDVAKRFKEGEVRLSFRTYHNYEYLISERW